MKIAFGSDHAGFDMKSLLMEHVRGMGHEVVDVGTHSRESCDYPEYGKKAAEAVMNGHAQFAIVVCGTGLGIGMAANKVKGFRCAVCTCATMAKLARSHNNAQGLALGARIIGIEVAKTIVETFLSTEFEGGRHQRRVDLIG